VLHEAFKHLNNLDELLAKAKSSHVNMKEMIILSPTEECISKEGLRIRVPFSTPGMLKRGTMAKMIFFDHTFSLTTKGWYLGIMGTSDIQGYFYPIAFNLSNKMDEDDVTAFFKDVHNWISALFDDPEVEVSQNNLHSPYFALFS